MKQLIFTLLLILSFSQTKAQNYKFGKISEEELLEKNHATDSTADAAVLYKEEVISYFYLKSEGFMQQREIHERIKIYTKDGFDWATKKIYLYKDAEKIGAVNAATFNFVNGKIEKNKLSNDGVFDENFNEYYNIKTITLPNVKVGSVIEYRYKITSKRIQIDDLIFQYNIPINKLDVKVATPEFFVFKKQPNYRAEYQPTIETSYSNNSIPFKYNIDIININEKNIPALREEAYAGNLSNYRSKLSLELSHILNNDKIITKSFSNTWEQVSENIYNSSDFGGQITKSNFYKDDLNVVIQGVTDNIKKTFLVENFVKSKVKWNGNYGKYAQKGIKTAYKEGDGNVADINLLLVAMLRSLGIDANPVLISTRDNGVPLSPTHDGFNYVICLVKNEGFSLLIDATEKYSFNNILPYRVLNWQGREIADNGKSSWVNLQPKSKSKETTMLNVSFDDDLKLTGNVIKQYTAHLAMNYRQKHNNLDIDEHIKAIETNKEGTEISALRYENDKNLNENLKVTYDYEFSDGIDQIGDKLYLNPLLFFSTKEVPFKLETRQYPIDFVIPIQDKYIVNIKLPEGYKVEALPKSETFVFNEENAAFKYIINNVGNYLRLTLDFEIKTPIILPSEYKDFKSFFSKYVEKQAEQIILTKV